MQYSIPKGLFDILPYETEEAWKFTPYWRYVESKIHEITSQYGFLEIRTPVFERTELFQRSVGDTSDIVTKEMYTFLDKGDRSMSLRPEGTAAVMRAFVEKNLANMGKIHKLYYIAPMFRYERPQSGRYRQHHQFGLEAIGISSPEQDAEVIDLLLEFYKRLGLKNLKLMINTVGDQSSRDSFKEALLAYLKPYFEDLSEDSKVRFLKNPLRILDSKDPKDQPIIEKAPSILDYLSKEAKKEFEDLLSLLDKLPISYKINDKLVRGLDYYNKTVFEVVSDSLGSQNTIGAGGRYDGLIAKFKGPDLPGIGFGTGIERILQTMLAQNVFFPKPPSPFVYFIPLEKDATTWCFQTVTHLRHLGLSAEIDLHVKNPAQALKQADKLRSKYCVLVGSKELENKKVTCKEMETHKQIEIPMDQLIKTLKDLDKS